MLPAVCELKIALLSLLTIYLPLHALLFNHFLISSPFSISFICFFLFCLPLYLSLALSPLPLLALNLPTTLCHGNRTGNAILYCMCGQMITFASWFCLACVHFD